MTPLGPPLPLDADGLLPEPSFDTFAPRRSYLVFAQQADARIDLATWQRHARQFFGADLALTRPKRYGRVAPRTDGAHVVLTQPRALAIHRSLFLRPRADDDLRAAELAGAGGGGGGLALLAKRCATIVLVAVDADSLDAGAGSLLLAALLSSVLLGPVMPPDRQRILGARSARQEHEKRTA